MSSRSGRRGRNRPILLLLILGLAACQPASPTPTAGPSPTAGSVVSPQPGIPKEALKGIAIEAWYPWLGVEASLFESEVEEFNRTNEWGLTVHATGQNSYSELYNQVTTALPSPDRPQIAIGLPEFALAWDASGSVVDLNDYINDPHYGLTSQEQADVPIIFWSQDDIAGRRLGVPAERSIRVLVYNSSWAHDLGFEAAPRTADDFRTQACRAHQAMLADTDKTNDGLGGWLVDTNATTFLSWLMAFGGGVLEGNGYRFLTPKNLAALTYVKQLYDDGCAWAAKPDADPATYVAGRQALFATTGLEDLPDYARAMGAANNGDQWTVLSFPGPVQNGLVIYGSSYVVLKSTPQEQLASWLFVRWLLSTENQKKWVEATGLLPLRTSSLGLLSGYTNSHPQWSAAVHLVSQGQIEPQLASWRQVRVMIGDGFSTMFQANTPSGRVAAILAIMGSTASDLSK